MPFDSTMSAFRLRTSTTALRAGTTARGCRVAFRTRDLPTFQPAASIATGRRGAGLARPASEHDHGPVQAIWSTYLTKATYTSVIHLGRRSIILASGMKDARAGPAPHA